LTGRTITHPRGILVPSPDANLRKPAIDVPPNACDCHVHIFGHPDRYPLDANRRYTPSPASLDEYRTLQASLGIERAVIVHPGVHLDNQVSIDAVQASGGKWRGIALLDASVTKQEIKRLDDIGFRGVRFNPFNAKQAALTDLEAVVSKIADFGWHAQFHLDARDLPDIADRLRKLPLDIVVDHMGRMPIAAGVQHPGFQILLALLRERKAWVKLSAPNRFEDPRPPYPNLLPFAQALVQAAPDRCVWATDWPHSSEFGFMPNDADLLDLLATWVPDARTRNAILVDNPARLYRYNT
jgi:2-pyrone-4,6-dicarboxylate lactonase